MHHGYTIKFCYHCQKNTSHAIVDNGSLKAYICVNTPQHAPKAGAD